ncbi:hypothetical protein IFM89_028248 [Coptis chinensis]|uniref:Leucine-rich repeat-containing N-terminal plant-type domain-containing protein n=1 Tax=Coptis chinensis TaxID=261450 RepID=A0A835IQ06_9MAGN|nr:hypothetical protein IFM89_028248 [Coptis chinensis]
MALQLLVSSLALLVCICPTISTNSEGNALHTLRTRLSDPNNVLQSWDPTLVNPCTWFHVTCDSSNHVIRLDLGNANISGSLGPELGELKHLQYLELYRNNIKGKIPKELGKLKNLISMDLYENALQGTIPKSLAKLKSLKFLRLNNNKLTGSIPRELAKLSNLKVFDVSNNDLCGTIPIDGPFGSFTRERYSSSASANCCLFALTCNILVCIYQFALLILLQYGSQFKIQLSNGFFVCNSVMKTMADSMAPSSKDLYRMILDVEADCICISCRIITCCGELHIQEVYVRP